MKLNLLFTPGFTRSLAGWEATIIVNGRGSLKCGWLSDAGAQERSVARHAFLLNAESFERLTHELACLPVEFRSSSMTDLATRSIRTVSHGAPLERHRFVYSKGNAHEVAFDRIWFELFVLVKPVLLQLGMPPELVGEAT